MIAMHDPLLHTVTATREVLDARLGTAEFHRANLRHPRDGHPAIDTFLASTSRHVSAAVEVLHAEVRRLVPDGTVRARALVTRARRLELAMGSAKAKLYGGAQAAHLPWSEVWAGLHRELDAFMALEEELVRDLVARSTALASDQLAERMHRAEVRAPTRPHPYVPHHGPAGWVARRICLQVDHFWDACEGRMVPEPVRHHDRAKDGPFTQYLLADPHLGD
ncbi:hypothetical protein [Nocardioides sp. AE5]|uniref:hypothetical protein n=1 Tax=Nocardioides sp. AE5 TaxID=2962573 RepID=UPI00288261A4|nr:hypothetical protein [Nocardioides sp. AE5]MDT0200578.1 hypothetical protein [Nocardioides sp. AE5]